MEINCERLKENLIELSKIGYNEDDRGIYRTGFSDADMEARRWLQQKAKSAGYDTFMDGAGNVFFGRGDRTEPTVLMGSHIDTVPAGGMFDGALGVMAALEVMQTLDDNGCSHETPIWAVATAEEEGRFGGMFGAQAIAGKLNPDWVLSAHDADNVYLKDAMAAQGLEAMDALDAAWRPEQLKGYLELHIEQGPVLIQENLQIGVVDGISGVFKWIVHLKGKADHAGTAPMHMRSDAFMGLADFAHEIDRIIAENGTDKTRITVGKVELKPGNPHTVPGEAVFTIVGRDMEESVMEEVASACRKALSAIARRHRLMFEYEQTSWLGPKPCSSKVTDLIEKQVKKRGYSYLRMPSGAGHDTQFMSEITDAGLIFIPSVNGVSHAPDEWSHWHDVEAGTNILLDAVQALIKN
ncbi:N-carbamoyl-L-amino acid hydrolase [Pseudidiomarina piscicola]|uniref:N-carbamoyl-L-amino acid hydrolase n=1 Tax=Pseudidiomarina piscicola TaxID=2614830 RepID=A0A6S6WLI9_9GAMM|nr:Zn-dependent hydrolase [Pseudidiomarina piscicola]CAB0150924.1 N-carbamoyl-L-amino acid hydrolase [Pseudidiomarina piscicola]VZT40430.1 N-carbamoyl-L-amino acid hydrolase [Pseudomonas aeruginosa]